MTIPIYLDKNLGIDNASVSLKKQTSTVTKISNISETKDTQQSKTSSENMSIQISQEARQLNAYLNSTENESIDSIDWNKINQIKHQVDAGTYEINDKKIAEKIMNFESKID